MGLWEGCAGFGSRRGSGLFATSYQTAQEAKGLREKGVPASPRMEVWLARSSWLESSAPFRWIPGGRWTVGDDIWPRGGEREVAHLSSTTAVDAIADFNSVSRLVLQLRKLWLDGGLSHIPDTPRRFSPW